MWDHTARNSCYGFSRRATGALPPSVPRTKHALFRYKWYEQLLYWRVRVSFPRDNGQSAGSQSLPLVAQKSGRPEAIWPLPASPWVVCSPDSPTDYTDWVLDLDKTRERKLRSPNVCACVRPETHNSPVWPRLLTVERVCTPECVVGFCSPLFLCFGLVCMLCGLCRLPEMTRSFWPPHGSLATADVFH